MIYQFRIYLHREGEARYLRRNEGLGGGYVSSLCSLLGEIGALAGTLRSSALRETQDMYVNPGQEGQRSTSHLGMSAMGNG